MFPVRIQTAEYTIHAGVLRHYEISPTIGKNVTAQVYQFILQHIRVAKMRSSFVVLPGEIM